jgi:hypothetical protein
MKRFAGMTLLIGVLVAVGRWLDLTNYTDLSTGLCSAGSVWWRYAEIGILLVLGALLALPVRKNTKALLRRSVSAGAAAMAGAILLVVASCMQLVGVLSTTALIQIVLQILCACWLVLLARAWMAEQWVTPSGGASMSVAGSALFYWLVVLRFMKNSSSYHYVMSSEAIVSALAVLLFLSSLGRALLLPDTANERAVCRSGLWAFWFGLCWELPQAVALWSSGNSDTAELLFALGVACVGALGGAAAILCAREWKTGTRSKH